MPNKLGMKCFQGGEKASETAIRSSPEKIKSPLEADENYFLQHFKGYDIRNSEKHESVEMNHSCRAAQVNKT